MPWCDTCSRYWNPPSLGAGGECPTCGRSLPAGAGAAGAAGGGAGRDVPRAPWHFKLLVAAAAFYLGARAWQAVQGVFGL